MVLSVLMFVIANWVSTLGLKYIPTGLAALIGALYPLSVVIIESVFFKARNINIITIAGMFLGLIGVGIVFYDTIFAKLSATSILGLGLSVFAMLSWSFGTIFLSRNKIKINPYYATGWQMVISSVVLSIISFSTHEYKPFADFGWKIWMEIFYLVIVGSVICFIAFIYSIKVLPPGIASLYAYINPLVAILVASILLKELLTINILLGAMVTVIGVFLVNFSHLKSKVVSELEI
jgi:drug/metabolite transporter (DMT)-like permease